MNLTHEHDQGVDEMATATTDRRTKRDGLTGIELPEILTEHGDDSERERLADQFQIQERALATVTERPAQVRERLDRLTEEYVDADERRRRALLAERPALAAELTLLPTDAEVTARKYAAALLAWARHVYIRAEAINNQLVDELNPLLRAYRELQQRIVAADVGTDREQRMVALNAERRAQAQVVTPIRERQAEALRFLQAINARLSLRFGVDCRDGTADPNVVARWVAGVRRSVEKGCA